MRRERTDASQDVVSLWQLRTMLMQGLATSTGECAAGERIARPDGTFLQVWPKAPPAPA